MRTFRTAVPLLIAVLTGAGGAAAQTPPAPPPPPPAAPPAAAEPAPATPPPLPGPGGAAPAATPGAPPVAPAQGAGGTAAPGAAPATPSTTPAAVPAVTGNWWDKFSGDAFVDAYGEINWNFPRPTYGQNFLHEYDQAGSGFSLNWAGADLTYASDPIGGTISLRFGPGALIHNAPGTNLVPANTITADDTYGLEFVRQAYATVKFAGAFTLDAGKYDQPFGSEVPDSQLNMNYTRSLLFTLNQPLFFTGLRLDYAPTSALDVKLIAANGWNDTIPNNTGKTVGGQISVKPIDQAQFYLGYAGGPQQADFTVVPALIPPGTGLPVGNHVVGALSNWRHLVDFVADINPSSSLRFLLNADYDMEPFPNPMGGGNDHAIWYGVNLAIHVVVADPFALTLRGEYFGDSHGNIVAPVDGKTSSSVESGTLTLSYVIASHFTLMLDNRVDVANSAIFDTTHGTSKTQVTSTLGVVASTK